MGDAWIEQAIFSVSRNCDTASPIALVARIVGQTFTRRGYFKGTDLMDTLSAAGGVSILYPGKHLAGTLNDYIRT